VSEQDDLERLRGPFVEYFPPGDPPEPGWDDLERGHPGVIDDRGPKHLSVVWIGHEDELVSTGAVYDLVGVREIDVDTFCERVRALRRGEPFDVPPASTP
jgi:hypothetical protein